MNCTAKINLTAATRQTVNVPIESTQQFNLKSHDKTLTGCKIFFKVKVIIHKLIFLEVRFLHKNHNISLISYLNVTLATQGAYIAGPPKN